MTITDSNLIKVQVFKLLPSPPSIIPPPIDLFLRLRPLCCGGRRVRPEYFEVDYCIAHTHLHLTTILWKLSTQMNFPDVRM